MSTYTFPAGRYSNTDTAFIKAYIDQEVAGVLDLAPEDLNTLNELAAAINNDPNYFATVGAQVAELNADVVSVVTALGVAEDDTSMGTFTAGVLPDASDLKAVLEAFALAWQTAKDNIEAEAASLSGRLDTLETDPTTAAAVAAVQADVDQNELDSDAAEAALSGRLDVLEADPTTATAVASGDAATLAAANLYTDGEITTLINGAPGVLDTLKELSDSLGGDADFVTTINASISAVQSDVDQNELDSDAAESALSGRLDVLEADPTTATALAAVQADVDQNELDSDAAEAALSGRLDALELDPTTQTYVDGINTALDARLDVLESDPTTATAVAAVQSDVDQNELDSDAADAALSGRLDTLEADPTTATAVAAVQSDVDQNEIDSDAADAALSGRLDVLEADPTTATALTNGLALKADLAGATFTGDVIVDEGAGPSIKLETSSTGNAGIVIEGSSGVYAYIDTAAGFANDSLQVYSGLFWVRAINGGDGTAMFDGDVTLQSGLTVNGATISMPNLPGPYNGDGDASNNGVALGSLYYDSNSHVRVRVS